MIAAEGENRAARALKDASDIINESSSALQLRYLQTLNSISAEKNSTIIFPLPTELLEYFARDWPLASQRVPEHVNSKRNTERSRLEQWARIESVYPTWTHYAIPSMSNLSYVKQKDILNSIKKMLGPIIVSFKCCPREV